MVLEEVAPATTWETLRYFYRFAEKIWYYAWPIPATAWAGLKTRGPKQSAR